MHDKNQKPYTGHVFVRWSHLNLTEEQAEKIARYEEKKDFLRLKTFFSFWEELNYENYVFNDILRPEQLKKYVEKRDLEIKEYENDLVEDDNSEQVLKDIETKNKEIKYLETIFLPVVLKKFQTELFLRPPYQTEYNFIKAGYKGYLDEKRHEVIINHFRDNRNFQPNILKEKLLHHKVNTIYPDFGGFKTQMDDATSLAIEFLKSGFGIFKQKKDEIIAISEALSFFREKAWDEQNKGRRYYAFIDLGETRSEEERENDVWFSLLLIDDDYYGYK
ncbi:MAG TPA: hypothetical protein VGI43_04450 [Mucilaginibacter sp.]|jgi:hypothetical protein